MSRLDFRPAARTLILAMTIFQTPRGPSEYVVEQPPQSNRKALEATASAIDSNNLL